MYRHAHWIAQWMNGKKPERLESMLYMNRQKREMTDEEMFERVKALHVMHGGELDADC